MSEGTLPTRRPGAAATAPPGQDGPRYDGDDEQYGLGERYGYGRYGDHDVPRYAVPLAVGPAASPASALPALPLLPAASRRTPGARTPARPEHRMVAAVHRWGAARPYVRGAARGLSLGGEHAAMWLAAGLAGAGLAEGERRAAWLRATALVAGAHAASMALKRIVRRPRPELDGGDGGGHGYGGDGGGLGDGGLGNSDGDIGLGNSGDSGFGNGGDSGLGDSGGNGNGGNGGARTRTAGRHGFPSSHAASSAAAAVAFGALAPRVPVAPLAAAVCLSRLVAGVHYPSDLAAGALLGAGAARLGRGWALGGGPGAPAGGTRGIRVGGGRGHG